MRETAQTFDFFRPRLAEMIDLRHPLAAYFSPSWTAFQTDRGRCFSVIVDDWGRAQVIS